MTRPGTIVLRLPPGAGNPRNSEGSFADLADGRILFAYSRFTGGAGDDARAVIAARCSHDGGRSWDRQDRILAADEGGQNVMSVSLLRLRSGSIALVYLVKHGPHDCRPVLRISTDEAATWSAPQPIIPDPGYHVVNNDRLVQLASGRLVVPAARHATMHAADGTPTIDQRATPVFCLSDDAGASWRVAPAGYTLTVGASGLQEPGVVELAPDEVWCWCRTDLGRQFALTSRDGGATWGPPCPTDFIAPCAPMAVKRLADRRLLAVWNDRSGRIPGPPPAAGTWGRTPLMAAWSGDDAITWTRQLILEDDPERGFCYPAIHDSRHGLFIAYCTGGTPGTPLDGLVVRRLD